MNISFISVLGVEDVLIVDTHIDYLLILLHTMSLGHLHLFLP